MANCRFRALSISELRIIESKIQFICVHYKLPCVLFLSCFVWLAGIVDSITTFAPIYRLYGRLDATIIVQKGATEVHSIAGNSL